MVSSRIATSARPVFPYRSRAYTILYYGTSRKGEFSTEEIKRCLSGSFPSQKTNQDFLTPANKLMKAGLVKRTKNNKWLVTEAGVKAMIQAAAHYREFRWRTVGVSYLENAYEKIRVINSSSMTLMEKLDAEDKILNQIEDLIRKRNHKKKYKKTTPV